MASGHITFLQLNDVHGYLEPHPEIVWTADGPRFPTLGGYARLGGLLAQLRRERDGAVIALDSGDTFHGTYAVVESRGEVLVPILNALGLDAMTGHWDFAWGPAHLKDLVSRLNYPLLAINCHDEDSGALTFPPTRVVERGGLRVGIVGIAATIVDKTMPARFSEGIRLSLGQDELPGHIACLREEEGADLVVLLSHLGLPQDVRLVETVPGLDAVLSGHTHNRLERPVWVNGTPIIQSGCHGSFAGRLDLEVRDGRVVGTDHRLIAIDDTIPEDAEVKSLVDAVLAPDRARLNAVVGRTARDLHRATMMEAPMDDLLLAAIAEAAGTSIAFSNGWRYGAPVPEGPVTLRDLWNIIPTDPPVSTVELTGAEMTVMLEENLERTFARDPFDQMGGYLKRCRGIRLQAKLENPQGCRVDRLFVDGAPVDPDRSYTVAFVTEQGVAKKYGRNRRNLDIRAIEALRRYLATHDPAAADGDAVMPV